LDDLDKNVIKNENNPGCGRLFEGDRPLDGDEWLLRGMRLPIADDELFTYEDDELLNEAEFELPPDEDDELPNEAGYELPAGGDTSLEGVAPSPVSKRDSKKGKVIKSRRRKPSSIIRFILRMIKRVIILAVLLAIAAAFYYYYRIYLPEVNSVKEYLLTEAVVRDLYSSISATGKISVTDEVSIFLKTPQKVGKVHVKEGDRVWDGQLLITYDIESELKTLEQKKQIAQINQLNAELGAQNIALPAAGNELLSYISDVNSAKKSIQDSGNSIESIKIRMAQQKIRVDDAKNLAEKNFELYEQGFLTRDEYDLSVSAHKSAVESMNDLSLMLDGEEQNMAYRRTVLTDAEQRLSNVRSALGDAASRLRYEQQLNIAELSRIEIEQIEDDMKNLIARTDSPVNGNVVSIGVVEGATASRGSAVIRLSDLTTLIVKADITQYDAPRLRAGQRVEIFVAGLPDKPYAGKIKKIAAASVEKESGSEKEVIVPVEIELLNADDLIKTGYSVDIDVIDKEFEDVLSIPAQALFSDGGEQFVYILAMAEEAAAMGGAPGAESGEGQAEDLSLLSAREVFIDGFTAIQSPDEAFGYVQTAFGWSLLKLDGLFPKRENDAPVPVRKIVKTGFSGENGVEILEGLSQGDMVVLNP